MRRLLTVAALGAALTLLIVLSHAASGWHYIVTAVPGTLLYAASFDEGQDDWQTYVGRLEASIVDGSLRIENGQVDSYAFSTARPYFSDFDLRLRAQAVSGTLNNGYGVVFRYQNPQNFYAFLVSSDGYYSVVRIAQGSQRWLSNWIDTPIVAQGIGVENLLRVRAVGDQFQFYVNDALMPLCIPDDPTAESTYVMGTCIEGSLAEMLRDETLTWGQVGVVALTFGEPDVAAAFDDVIIYSPERDA